MNWIHRHEVAVMLAVVIIGPVLEAVVHRVYREFTGKVLWIDLPWKKTKSRFVRDKSKK